LLRVILSMFIDFFSTMTMQLRYKVELFNSDELNLYGNFGIKLRPVDEMKRMWLIRAESEDELNQWIEVSIVLAY